VICSNPDRAGLRAAAAESLERGQGECWTWIAAEPVRRLRYLCLGRERPVIATGDSRDRPRETDS